MKIVLIGFMGSGKSRIGRLLAKKCNWPYYDTDDMILKETGSSVPDLIRTRGEKAFRDIERDIVSKASSLDDCIISTGGGVPLDPDNMKKLGTHSEVIWIQVLPEIALKRIRDIKTRPLIDSRHPLDSIRNKMSERNKFYSLAKHHIDSNDLPPDKIVEKILQMIPSLPR